MKLKSLLLTLGATLAVGLGALAGVTSMDKGAKEVKAASYPTDGAIRVYFDHNGKAGLDDGKFMRLHYWGNADDSTSWSGIKALGSVTKYSRTIYYWDVPSDTTGLIFGRFSSGAAANADPEVRWTVEDNNGWDWSANYNYIQASGTDGSYSLFMASTITLKDGDTVLGYDAIIDSWNETYYPTLTPTKEGYNFAGWYENSDFSGSQWETAAVPSDLTLYAKFAKDTVTITKYVYYDGVYQSETSETVEKNSSYTLTDPIDVVGYVFTGWYWWTEEAQDGTHFIYPVENLATDDNYEIYAVYKSRSSFSQDNYFYYVADILNDGNNNPQDTPNYIYSYGGHNEFGAWPGTAITSVATDVHGSFGFQGYADDGYTRHIYKIPYTSAFADDHIIIVYNNGKDKGGDQTANMPLTHQSAYWWESTAANVPAGVAIDFLVYAESIRNGVNASGNILDYSVCGITPAQAADLYGKYEKLTDKDVYVDSTYTYTYLGKYDGETVPSEGSVCYYDIMVQLYEIALRDATFASTHSARNVGVLSVLGENSNNTLIIIAIAGVSLLAVAGFFLLKRKEER